MKLEKIYIHCFRNIEEAELRFGDRFNIIVGKNAQGKTNLLESIFLLGTMKAFRSGRNCDLIRYESSLSVIKGWVSRDGVSREISLSITESGKKAHIDGKPVTRVSDFFGNLNMVLFSPEDISMTRGVPDLRRKYLDRAIFGGDTGYLSIHHEYYRILKNRNALLRLGERDGLAAWTERLADAGARLMVKRVSFTEEICPVLREFYGGIAGPGEEAEIRYRTVPHAPCSSVQSLRCALTEALEKRVPEEIRRGTTLAGPHRDDLEFMLNGKPLNHHGSQGEQRSFILALKMAEIEHLKRKWSKPPLLLLDDMTSELDRDRNGNFMNFLRQREMQVFITTTGLENINLSGINDYSTFPVHDGRVSTEVANV